MSLSMQSNIKLARFKISELQTRLSVLELTREDLNRQIKKLEASVPEEQVAPNETREGYFSYGSYAKSVIERKQNLRQSLQDIIEQHADLAKELKEEMASLDSYERVKARQMAAKAEKATRGRTG